jgi:PKD repeat protein
MRSVFLFLLIVAVSCKKDKSIKEPIEIIPTPEVFTPNVSVVDSSSVIIGDSVSYILTGDLPQNNVEYNWFFNGGTPNSSKAINPKIKYKTPGVYDVKLIINYGDTADTIVKPAFVNVKSTITEGLIAYYPFSGNAKDMTGRGHDGNAKDAILTTDRFGNENSAYLFNGETSSIIVKDKEDIRLSQTDFTINGWLKLDRFDPSYGASFIIKRFTGPHNGWGTSITGYAFQRDVGNKAGSPFFYVSGGGDPYAIGGKQVELDKWCMFTVVYNLDLRTVQLFINGKLDNITYNIPSPIGDINADLFIGSDSDVGTPGYHIKGKIDDIGMYHRALSEKEINRIFFNSETSTPPVFDK